LPSSPDPFFSNLVPPDGPFVFVFFSYLPFSFPFFNFSVNFIARSDCSPFFFELFFPSLEEFACDGRGPFGQFDPQTSFLVGCSSLSVFLPFLYVFKFMLVEEEADPHFPYLLLFFFFRSTRILKVLVLLPLFQMFPFPPFQPDSPFSLPSSPDFRVPRGIKLLSVPLFSLEVALFLLPRGRCQYSPLPFLHFSLRNFPSAEALLLTLLFVFADEPLSPSQSFPLCLFPPYCTSPIRLVWRHIVSMKFPTFLSSLRLPFYFPQ